MRSVMIGMPVWNGERFLSEVIESILGQTYGDLELVISDNASTDATAEICRSYARHDDRISYMRQEKNIGAGPNHNEVLRRASGRYFKWACHDDVLAPIFIEECVRVLDADEAVVVCCPATVLINDDGSPLRYSPQDQGMVDNHGNVWRVKKNTPLTSADPADRFTAVLCNMDWCFEIYGLMRRSALGRVSSMPAYYGGDKVVLAELSLLGRYHLLEAPLFYRRCHPRQSSSPQTSRYRAMWISGGKRQILPPQIKLMAAYVRAASSAKLTPVQRSRCFSAIGRRAVTVGLLGSVAPHRPRRNYLRAIIETARRPQRLPGQSDGGTPP
jgi:glycosyltransferase involved in cell wall biosynthesis